MRSAQSSLVVPRTTAITAPRSCAGLEMGALLLRERAKVNAEAKPAVIEETAIYEITIHTAVMARPVFDTGARSP